VDEAADYVNRRKEMSLFNVLFRIALGLLVAMVLTERQASAYADPSSGALLWQLFFASIVSIGFHFRKLRVWITNRWLKR